MMAKATGKVAVLFVLCLVLSACGDMVSLFPPGDSYLVRINVNGTPVEGGSSIVRSGDKISPYFALAIGNDPDVTGLLVYLRNQYGEIIGYSVRFVISASANGVMETEAEDEDEGYVDADNQSMARNSVIEIAVRSFEQDLPSFTLPEDMEIGQHTMVFEVFGERAVLRRTEIPILYLGNAEFSLRDISMSLPGLFSSRLVPPGTKILLEARLDFDNRLDPYLIWHSGRNIISEGRIREGAGGVLWEAPSQTAFHPLRLEILPFPPVGIRRNLAGISREILLPVSATAESASFFFCPTSGHLALNRLAEGVFHLDPPEHGVDTPTLYRWYQFKGRLHDTMSAHDEDRFLAPANEAIPRWTSIGHSYGLSTGNDNAFLLSPINFFGEEQDHGGGIFLFHIMPIADGTIFSAFFPSNSPVGGAWIDISMDGHAIVLRLGTAEATVEMPMILAYSDLRTFVPAAVKFYIHPDRMEANLSLGENAFIQSPVQEVRLSDALTGEGIARLGGAPLDSWAQASVSRIVSLSSTFNEDPADTITASDIEDDIGFPADIEDGSPEWDQTEIFPPSGMEIEAIDHSIATVWNEFAIMLSSLPFPKPGFPAEEAIYETENDDLATAISPESNNHPAHTQEKASLDFTEAEARETGPGTTLYETTETYAEETEMPT